MALMKLQKRASLDIPAFDTNKILWRAGAKFSWEETTGRLWKGYKYHTYSKDEVSIISLISSPGPPCGLQHSAP